MRITSFLLVLCILACLGACQQSSTADSARIKKGMVKVTILYPNSEGKTFDMDYYAQKHMPMVADLLKEGIKFYTIDKGLASGRPGEPMPYLAIGYLYFDKLSDYQEVFGPNAEKIVNDIPNYTNIQPIVQVSEIFE